MAEGQAREPLPGEGGDAEVENRRALPPLVRTIERIVAVVAGLAVLVGVGSGAWLGLGAEDAYRAALPDARLVKGGRTLREIVGPPAVDARGRSRVAFQDFHCEGESLFFVTEHRCEGRVKYPTRDGRSYVVDVGGTRSAPTFAAGSRELAGRVGDDAGIPRRVPTGKPEVDDPFVAFAPYDRWLAASRLERLVPRPVRLERLPEEQRGKMAMDEGIPPIAQTRRAAVRWVDPARPEAPLAVLRSDFDMEQRAYLETAGPGFEEVLSGKKTLAALVAGFQATPQRPYYALTRMVLELRDRPFAEAHGAALLTRALTPHTPNVDWSHAVAGIMSEVARVWDGCEEPGSLRRPRCADQVASAARAWPLVDVGRVRGGVDVTLEGGVGEPPGPEVPAAPPRSYFWYDLFLGRWVGVIPAAVALYALGWLILDRCRIRRWRRLLAGDARAVPAGCVAVRGRVVAQGAEPVMAVQIRLCDEVTESTSRRGRVSYHVSHVEAARSVNVRPFQLDAQGERLMVAPTTSDKLIDVLRRESEALLRAQLVPGDEVVAVGRRVEIGGTARLEAPPGGKLVLRTDREPPRPSAVTEFVARLFAAETVLLYALVGVTPISACVLLLLTLFFVPYALKRLPGRAWFDGGRQEFPV